MGIFEQLAEIKAKEGREIGIAKGIAKGKEEATHLFVENLLRDSDFPLEKIASMTNVTISFVKKVKKTLPAK